MPFGEDPTSALQTMSTKNISRLLATAALVFFGSTAAVGANPIQRDQGTKPWVVNIEKLTTDNQDFRDTRWTGRQLQLTVMSLNPGEDIGLEVHERGDQFIRVEQGKAHVQMGPSESNLTYAKTVLDDWAIFIPEGYWHNITNRGTNPLKVYVIYAPPEHPHGTRHQSKPSDEH